MEDEQEEQTFAEFQDMGKRPPNLDGTGRFLLTPERRTIAVLNLCKRSSLSEERLSRLSAYLRCFLQLDVAQSAASGELSMLASKRKTDIVDHKQGIVFPLRVLRGGLTDVFSLFDVMVEYVGHQDYALLALVDVKLGEEIEDNVEVAEVLGRACGDRVAAVQCYAGMSDVELFGTATHELLHTCGFDHTTFWRCLMNPALDCQVWQAGDPNVGSQLFLAPHNLRKLMHFLHRDEDNTWVLSRYKHLKSQWWSFFDKSSQEASAHFLWLQTKIKALESLDDTDSVVVLSSSCSPPEESVPTSSSKGCSSLSASTGTDRLPQKRRRS